jgi:hypothetical protein
MNGSTRIQSPLHESHVMRMADMMDWWDWWERSFCALPRAQGDKVM